MSVEKMHIELKKLVKGSLAIQETKLLNLIKDRLEKGYNVYSNIDDINELIDIIVNWYEFKYPRSKIRMIEEKCVPGFMLFELGDRFKEIENLDSYMGYIELMFRIPERLHPIVECWYKGDEKEFLDIDFITTTIIKEHSITKPSQRLAIDKYDGYFNLDYIENKKLLKIDCFTIDEFIEKNKDNIEFDLEKLKKVALTHEYDLEIRKEIFNLIALKLLSSKDGFTKGYIRAKKFIEEFNKYIYNLNLSTDIIEKESSLGFEYLDKTPPYWGGYNNAREIVNNMVLKLKPTEQKSIEECGLSFKTLCLLNNEKIYMKDDPNIEKVIKNWAEYYHFGQHIPYRDKKIFDDLIEHIGLIKSIEILVKAQFDIPVEQNKEKNENKDIKKKIYRLFSRRKTKCR